VYPDVFEIGGLTLKTFTACAVLAMLAALLPVRAEARRRGWNVRSMTWLVFISTAVGFLGAHILYAITRFDLPSTQWWRMLFNVWYGNVWYGGVLAAWPVVHYYAKRHRIVPLALYDVAAFAVLIAQAIGRLGCFFNGCCYGTPTTLPWGVVIRSREYAETGLHPTPLYEALYLAIAGAWLWRTRVSRRPGEVAALYLILTAAGRFVLEFLRGDRIRGFVWGWVSTSQFIGFLLLVAGSLLYASVVSREQNANLSKG
jgi:phosphatidylglycerol:prolipoprotein diacylglycerol transferase